MGGAFVRNRRPSRRRGRRRWLGLVVVLGLGLPTAAIAAYPVVDELGIAKLLEIKRQIMEEVKLATEQVKILTDSLSFLKDINGAINDVFAAMGEMSTIKLPITSLPSIKRQAEANWRCLTQMGDLAPDLDFDDIDFGSLCGARSAIRAAYFLDPVALSKLSMPQQNSQRQVVQQRREKLVADAVSEALAASTAAQKKTLTDMASTLDQLQGALDRAKTVNDRLAVIGQIELARYQGDINDYALQASMLRLQGAMALRQIPVSSLSPAGTP